MYERYDRKEETSSVKISRGKVAEQKRKLQIAVFSESTEFLQIIKETKDKLVNDSFDLLLVYITVISVVCLFMFLLLMEKTVKKVTK